MKHSCRTTETAAAADLPSAASPIDSSESAPDQSSACGERTPARFPDFPEFRPHPLLRSGHLQTIATSFSPRPEIPYRARQRQVELPGGERLVLHDDRPESWRPGDRCVLLLHGLGGCYLSPYMMRMAAKLNARGARTFRMDMRGHGAGATLAWSPGHAGRSEDAAAAVQCIVDLCPASPLAVAGVSLGGNILLKWLGEAGADAHPQVDRALAVAPPIDLLACCQLIRRWRSRLYDRAFVKELLGQVAERRDHWESLRTLDWSRPPRTLFEFDDRVTAPLSGFRDAMDYYANASAASKLAGIAVPTLILTAADDPLVPPYLFEQAERSEFVQLHVTRHGGHVGYIARRGLDPDRRWLDWRVVDWATAELGAVEPPRPELRKPR